MVRPTAETHFDAFPTGSQPLAFERRLAGVEQEYYVLSGDTRVDFRDWVHRLGVPGSRIDPGDANAYRLPEGSLLTADGREAEIATIPRQIGPGLAALVAAEASAHTVRLKALAGPALRFVGASTHINVSVPKGREEAVAQAFISFFGAEMLMLWGRPIGKGLFIRPRPERLELCGEYLTGRALEAAILFAAASVQALLVGSLPDCPLPPSARAVTRPSPERYGFTLRPAAYGSDLYAVEDPELQLVGGGALSLAAHADAAFTAVLPRLVSLAPHDLTRHIASLLGVRIRNSEIEAAALQGDVRAAAASAPFLPTPLAGWRRPGPTTIEPLYDTWDTTAFRIQNGGKPAFAVVPRDDLGCFVAAVESGALDHPPIANRGVLSHREQAAWPGLFESVDSPESLLPRERAPDGTAAGSAGSGESRAGGTTRTRSDVDPDRPSKRRTTVRLAGPPPELQVQVAAPPAGESKRGCLLPPVALGVLLAAGIAIGIAVLIWGRASGGVSSGAPTVVTPPGGSAATLTSQPAQAPATSQPTQPAPATQAAQATPTSGAAQPTPTVQPVQATATSQPAQPTPTTQPAQATPTSVAAQPTPAPVPQVISAQLQFTQIVSRYTGTCPPNAPPPGTNLSPATPSRVVVDWQNHTIKIGDSNVSPFDPATRLARVSWPDGRYSNVTIGPNGLSGESGFAPYANNPPYSSCMVVFTTSATVVDGQVLVP